MRRLPGIREKKQEILPAGYLFDNRALKRLIAPLIIEQILAVTVGMVDTMMVSSVGVFFSAFLFTLKQKNA